jgi:hypothetical protein
MTNIEKEIPQHDFIIAPTDTDSISFCKKDMAEFSKEELVALLKELNDISPDLITWEDDGYYKKVLVLKAKNYILYDPTKEKEKDRKQIKGSAFKSSSKEPALAQMMQDMVNAILDDRQNELLSIYERYVDEALNIKDINRWCQKKTASAPVLKCRGYEKFSKEALKAKGIRANETNIWDAIKNEELIQQGEKYYIYPAILAREEVKTEKTLKSGKVKVTTKVVEKHGLKMAKHWANGDQNVVKLLERIYDTVSIFGTVLDLGQFTNYSLVKNYKTLLESKNSA